VRPGYVRRVQVLAPGDRIERFRIDAVLVQRDDAVVYAATEDETSRSVAISVLGGAAGDDAMLRSRAERAERTAGLGRLSAVEPIVIGRLPDGTGFVVNERAASLPIVARSAAPIGAVFGTSGPGTSMDAGRAVLSLTSQRARRRAEGRLARLLVRAVIALAIGGAAWLAWLALR
jgi:hypothetical protein